MEKDISKGSYTWRIVAMATLLLALLAMAPWVVVMPPQIPLANAAINETIQDTNIGIGIGISNTDKSTHHHYHITPTPAPDVAGAVSNSIIESTSAAKSVVADVKKFMTVISAKITA